MAWHYEILGKDDEVLEASEPVYATQFDAHMAGCSLKRFLSSLVCGMLCGRNA